MAKSMYIEKEQSKSMMIPSGNINQVRHMVYIRITHAMQKNSKSKDIVSKAYFKKSLTPSVIGVSRPKKNKDGPTRMCSKARYLRSTNEK